MLDEPVTDVSGLMSDLSIWHREGTEPTKLSVKLMFCVTYLHNYTIYLIEFDT